MKQHTSPIYWTWKNPFYCTLISTLIAFYSTFTICRVLLNCLSLLAWHHGCPTLLCFFPPSTAWIHTVQEEVKFTVNPQKHKNIILWQSKKKEKKKNTSCFRLVCTALKKYIEHKPEESSHSNHILSLFSQLNPIHQILTYIFGNFLSCIF